MRGVFGFQIVVDEDDEGEREGFLGEDVDGLFDVVVEDAEVGLAEVGNELAILVFYGDREDDEVGVDGDFGLGVGLGRFCGWRLLRRDCGSGCRRGR